MIINGFIFGLGFTFTFVFSPLVCFQFFDQLLQPSFRLRCRIFLISAGLGPLLLSWLLVMTMMCTPRLSVVCHVGIVAAIMVFVFLITKKKALVICRIIRYLISLVREDIRSNFLYLICFLICGCILAAAASLAIMVPLISNDASEYMHLADMFFHGASVYIYPILNGASSNGFMFATTHPLGYVGMILWLKVVQGSMVTYGAIRILAIYYVFLVSSLIYTTFRIENKKNLAWISCLLLLTTPLYVLGGVKHQIDPLRIFTFAAFFIFVGNLYIKPTQRYVLGAGCILGLGLFCHSLSLFEIPLFFVITMLFIRDISLIKRSLIFISVTFVGLIFVTPRYIVNIYKIGYIIHDGTPVRNLIALHFDLFRQLISGLYSQSDKLIFGFMKLFYSWGYFGSSYFILMCGIFLLSKKHVRRLFFFGIRANSYIDLTISISALLAIGYLSIMLISVLMGSTAFIINMRYMITVQPAVAIFSGFLLINLIHKLKLSLRTQSKFLASLSLLLFSITGLMLISVFDSYFSVFGFTGSDFNRGEAVEPILRNYTFYKKNHDKKSGYLFAFRNGDASHMIDKYVFHTDPRLINFYNSSSVAQAYSALKKIGVGWVSLPSYTIPSKASDALVSLLGDPNYSHIVRDIDGNKLFVINKNRLKAKFSKDLLPKRISSIYGLSYKNRLLCEGHANACPFYPFMTGKYVLVNNQIKLGSDSKIIVNVPNLVRGKYLFSFDLCGYGNLSGSVLQTDRSENPVSEYPVFSIVIYSPKCKKYNFQFISPSNTLKDRHIVISHRYMGWMTIKKVSLSRIIEHNNQYVYYRKISLLQELGWDFYLPKSYFKYLYEKLRSILNKSAIEDRDNDNDVYSWSMRNSSKGAVVSLTDLKNISHYIDFPIIKNEHSTVLGFRGCGSVKVSLIGLNRGISTDENLIHVYNINLSSHPSHIVLGNYYTILHEMPENISTKLDEFKVKVGYKPLTSCHNNGFEMTDSNYK